SGNAAACIYSSNQFALFPMAICHFAQAFASLSSYAPKRAGRPAGGTLRDSGATPAQNYGGPHAMTLNVLRASLCAALMLAGSAGVAAADTLELSVFYNDKDNFGDTMRWW